MAIEKKYGRMKIQVPKKEEMLDTWSSKKKREIKERKDSHVHKRVKLEREGHAKWSYNKSDGNN
jgi:hypothetical protein